MKLFGHGYSGLEYDYRGLIRLYHETENPDQATVYIDKLSSWAVLRDNQEEALTDPLEFINLEDKPVSSSYRSFIKQSEDLHPNINETHSLLDLPSLGKDWHCPKPSTNHTDSTGVPMVVSSCNHPIPETSDKLA